ncbi:hypothetical protein BJ742DRAFT_508698 [Cladochytrium replicatum]|nr:hypothetical protein BJ742DRAFT_508698 [Cladochytrium replicatum]
MICHLLVMAQPHKGPTFPAERLLELRIADTAEDWERAGFAVSRIPELIHPFVTVGKVRISLVGPNAIGDRGRIVRGIAGWSWETSPVHGGDMIFNIDGLATALVSPRDTEHRSYASNPVSHPNGVTRIDHIVVFSPAVDRTAFACGYLGWKVKRTRDVNGRRYMFMKVDDVVIELVGPAIDYPLPGFRPSNDPNHPALRPWETMKGDDAAEAVATEIREFTGNVARLWGITFICDNIVNSHKSMGSFARTLKDAVQPGRKIFTLDQSAGVSTNVAFISESERISNPKL